MSDAIERIVEQAGNSPDGYALEFKPWGTLCARLAYVAGMREAARIADKHAERYKGGMKSDLLGYPPDPMIPKCRMGGKMVAANTVAHAILSAADAIERGE